MPDEYEFMVKSRRSEPFEREWEQGPMDEESATFLMALTSPHVTRTLYRRRKASPWRKTRQPHPTGGANDA